MKTTNSLWIMGLMFILSMMGGCSSGGSEDIPTPTPPPVVEKDYITIQKDSLQATCQGGELTISFTTNKAWTASSSQAWCTLSTTSGEKGTASLKATVAENTAYNERSVIITIKAGTVSQKITITQEPAEKDKLELANTSFTVSAEGKEILIPFYTDVTWEAASNQEWCTLLATSGESGNQSLTVKIAKNKEKKERQATITFKAGTANPQTVTITQEAAPPDEIDMDKTSFEVGNDGKTIELTFTTNVSWMIASNQSWCTLSTANGDEGTHTLTITVDKNTSYDDRTATITLKAGNAQEIVTITQEKRYHLKVSYKGSVVDYAGGTVSMTVQCNTQYEISIGGNWIKQTKNKNTRSLKEETVSFEIDMNNADKGREADITFFNKERNLKETITIKQQAKPEDTSVKPSGNVGNMIWG